MHSLRDGLQNKLVASALALTLAALWLLTRGYQGFSGDAQIYAFQALARVHPILSSDLYLQYTSQDQYTLFSPFYAWFVRWLGLEHAARLLTLFFTVWMVAAVWYLAAEITEKRIAWLAVAFFVVTAGDYGASGVFRIFESYLTARLPAQALVITAIALHLRGMKVAGVLLGIAALFIHPLMALPGLMVLVCLGLPVRHTLVAAAAAVFAALGIALSTSALPAAAHAFGIMDPEWLEVVEERSQFLFLQLWSWRDWDMNLRPLLYLAFITMLLDGPRTRQLCISALLVGICGLAIAGIACLADPVALLVQGQAWRWVWPACLLSVVLLPAAIFQVWHDEKCGALCAVLLISGWVVSAVGGMACVLLAVLVWLLRENINERAIPVIRWSAIAAAVAALAWLIQGVFGLKPMNFATIAALPAVRVFAISLFGILWCCLRTARGIGPPAVVCGLMLIASICIAPTSFKQARVLVSQSSVEEFADWSAAIPAASTVLVAPPRDVGAFVWFTLERPNYLALDQSAGVVFSRDTALEVRRRSELLLPLMDPTWKILSGIRRGALKHEDAPPTRPLTAQSLMHVCSDPNLGFVISPQDIGFARLRHEHAGAWKDWNLYDCAHIRSIGPKT